MKVRFTAPARADLEEIGDWIAQENAIRAASFTAEIRKACASLARHPRRYPIASAVSSGEIRKKTYRRYLIFYRILDQEVQVVRVVHGSRDWAAVIDV